MQKNRVFINFSDCVCSAGKNKEEIFSNILHSITGIRQNEIYLQDKCIAIGTVENLEKFFFGSLEFLKNKNLDKTLLVIGSSVGGMSLSEEIFFREKNFKKINPKLHEINSIQYKITKKFKFKDSISFSTACTSSANALGYAYETLSKGIYESALVIGYDTLCKTTVGGFNSLGVLSSFTCKPFNKNRDGMNVAEGFALLFLETKAQKKSIEICSVGYSSDAFHMTQPNPQGAIQAMQNALKNANLQAEDIDYINAHGTGTLANDKSEIEAIKNIFGYTTCISSTKSITGHTLGAAGALEAIICTLAIEKGILPPNFNLAEPEDEKINFILSPQQKNIKYALSNSFAFGGNNTSVIFGQVE